MGKGNSIAVAGTVSGNGLHRDNVGLITRRSRVRITPPLLCSGKTENSEKTRPGRSRLIRPAGPVADVGPNDGQIAVGPSVSSNLPLLARKLDRYVDRSGGPDTCWPWTRSRIEDGYGRLFIGDGQELAHRAALMVKLGRDLLPGMCALHSCDNPPCCNPAHLFEGTKGDNNADCIAKGRSVCLWNEDHPQAKLTNAQVDEIRRLCSAGKRGIYTQLARRFGVSIRQISYIALGKRRPLSARAA